MATAIDANTNIEAEIQKTKKLEKIFGYTSNKFGRVCLVTLGAYNNMILNNDTLRDRNGLNDKFANLEGEELKLVEKSVKTGDAKLVKKAQKVIAGKVSGLTNFMQKYKAGIIPDNKTGLVVEILEQLEAPKGGATPDNSAELNKKDKEIEALKLQSEKDSKAQAEEIADLKAQLKAPKVDTETKGDDEDSPFDEEETK